MLLSILPNFGETSLILSIVLLIVGLVVIVKGGDFFVDASVWIAEVFKMPKFLIGATLVSIATTLPEMIVSIIAVADGNFDISIGNAVGSVTANTGLILAISAIFVGGTVNRKEFGVKAFLILLSSIVMFAFSLSGKFGIIPSILLIAILIYYMIDITLSAKKAAAENPETEDEEEIKKDGKTITINVVKFLLGAAGIVLGADLLVTNASNIATALHISDAIIAITIVAIGTSLPELVTTITSIVKKQGDLGVGNVIGANIIDLVLILPICSFISGGNLVVSDQSRFLDMPVLIALSTLAVVPTLITKKFSKWQGILMLIGYIAYVVFAAVIF